jgi:hypothetical protein
MQFYLPSLLSIATEASSWINKTLLLVKQQKWLSEFCVKIHRVASKNWGRSGDRKHTYFFFWPYNVPTLCRGYNVPTLCRGYMPPLCRDYNVPTLCRGYNVPTLCRDYNVPTLCRDYNVPTLCRGYNVATLFWNLRKRSLACRERGTLQKRYVLWSTVRLSVL